MKARILSLLSILLAVFWISSSSIAQPITTIAPNVQTCPGTNISVPITVNDFNNVASLSLALNYDVASLTYLNYTANPSLSGGGGFLLVNAANGQVKAAYFGLSPLSLPSGTVLFTFNFTLVTGSSTLVWDLITQGNCQYSDISGNDLQAAWVDGSVTPSHAAPTLSLNPSNFSITSGGMATFNVTGANATNYNWQESSNGGSTWTNIVDGGSYNGATTNTLTIMPANVPMNGNQYRCHLSENVCNQSINSTAATLTVTAPVNNIIVTASNLVACPGTSVSVAINGTSMNDFEFFTMRFTYDPAVLTYSSFSNLNASLSGASISNTGNEVEITYNSANPINVADGKIVDLHFQYTGGTSDLTWSTVPGQCEFTNLTSGILNSTFVNGAVNPQSVAPVIATQPADKNVSAGTNTNFSVTANNATTYKWQLSTDGGISWTDLVNSSAYNNVSTSTLTVIQPGLTSNGYMFRCVVGESVCNQTATSNAATLTVSAPTSGIITTIGNMTSCPGSLVTFPVNVTNFNDIASFSLTLGFDPTVLTFSAINNVESNILAGTFISNNTSNMVLVAWFSVSPLNLGNIHLMDIDFNYLGGNDELTWDTITAGSCQYSDINGIPLESTFISGTISSTGAAPAITQNPMSAGANVGGSVTFTAAAQGTGLTYQWQISTNNGTTWTDVVNGGVYSGANTGTLTINPVDNSFNGYQYKAIITGGTCNSSSSTTAATLSIVPAGTIVTTAGYVNTCPGGSIVVPITVTEFANVASASLKLNYNTQALTFDGYQNENPALAGGFMTVAANNGQVGFGWFSLTPANIPNGTLIEYKFIYNNNFSPLDWDLTPGNCLYSDLTGNTIPAIFVNGQVTSPGPVITSSPANVNATEGDNVTFSVTATNASGYQWQKNTTGTWVNMINTTSVSGVNSNTLNIHPVTGAMNNTLYRCIVSGTCGTSHSGEATLHVTTINPVHATAGTVTGCAGSLLIPINVADFNNVGSFNLKLTYVPSVLNYISYSNVNPALTGTLTITAGVGNININYSGSTPVNIGTDLLLNLNISGLSGSSALTWDITTPGMCQFLTVGSAVLPSSFTNGSLSVSPLPGFPSTISGPGTLCQGTVNSNYSITGAANATSYNWAINPPDAGTIVGSGLSAVVTWDPTFVGNATVTVNGVNACGNGPQNGKGIVITATPVVTMTPFPNTCINITPFNLTGGAPFGGTYSGTGVTNGIFDPSAAGLGTFTITYSVTSSGCTGTATETITVNDAPVVTYTPPVTQVCPYWTVNLTGGLPVGGTYSGVNVNSTTGVFSPSTTQVGNAVNIIYSFTNTAGCSSNSSAVIFVNACVGIDNIASETGVRLSPNPSNGQFDLNITGISEELNLNIYNDLGQSVYSEKIMTNTNEFSKQIDLSNQPKGLYFLRINGNTTDKQEKIVIQ